jgi:hypothetical protein
MKKQIKKLSLNKKTISNLIVQEMSNKIGGGSQGYCGPTNGDDTTCRHCGYTKNQKTCPGHKTCYTC